MVRTAVPARRLRAAVLASLAACVLLAGCGPKVVRETVFESRGVTVKLRSVEARGDAPKRDFDHPATISAVRLANILSRIDARPPGKSEDARVLAVPTPLLYPMAEGLSRALEKATPEQEVVVTAVRRERRLGIFTEERLTSLVAWVDDDQLHLHFVDLDRPVPKGPDGPEIPEPWAGRTTQRFRLLPADGIAVTGPQSVAVAWRDPRFRDARALRVSPTGEVMRRTILMEAPEEEPAAAPGGAGAAAPLPPDLSPETLRALADLEEARRSGAITEAEYQARRRALLEGR